eukprot:1959210-Lingulodinium_polyedra.AAC.2
MLEHDGCAPRRRHASFAGMVRVQGYNSHLAGRQPPTVCHFGLGTPLAFFQHPLLWTRLVVLRLCRRPLAQVGASHFPGLRDTCLAQSGTDGLLAGCSRTTQCRKQRCGVLQLLCGCCARRGVARNGFTRGGNALR